MDAMYLQDMDKHYRKGCFSIVLGAAESVWVAIAVVAMVKGWA